MVIHLLIFYFKSKLKNIKKKGMLVNCTVTGNIIIEENKFPHRGGMNSLTTMSWYIIIFCFINSPFSFKYFI